VNPFHPQLDRIGECRLNADRWARHREAMRPESNSWLGGESELPLGEFPCTGIWASTDGETSFGADPAHARPSGERGLCEHQFAKQ
jgi:hypothetical protein